MISSQEEIHISLFHLRAEITCQIGSPHRRTTEIFSHAPLPPNHMSDSDTESHAENLTPLRYSAALWDSQIFPKSRDIRMPTASEILRHRNHMSDSESHLRFSNISLRDILIRISHSHSREITCQILIQIWDSQFSLWDSLSHIWDSQISQSHKIFSHFPFPFTAERYSHSKHLRFSSLRGILIHKYLSLPRHSLREILTHSLWRELNPWPIAYEAIALTTELQRHWLTVMSLIPGGTWTRNLLLRRETPSPLGHRDTHTHKPLTGVEPVTLCLQGKCSNHWATEALIDCLRMNHEWSRVLPDSNRWPQDLQSHALPLS